MNSIPTNEKSATRASAGSSVYGGLRDRLREALLANYTAGDRLPSERQLARDYGVSPVTISKALQDLSREGVLYRISGHGTFLGRSHPMTETLPWSAAPYAGNMGNASGLSLAPSSNGAAVTAVTGIVTRLRHYHKKRIQNSHAWSHDVVSEVERFIQSSGGKTIVFDPSESPGHPVIGQLDQLLGQGVNSIVFLNCAEEWMFEMMALRDRLSTDFPIVYVSTADVNPWPFDCIRTDGVQEAYIATKHLLTLGHRSLVMVVPAEPFSWIKQRITGFQLALKSHQAAGVTGEVLTLDSLPLDTEQYWVENGLLAARRRDLPGTFTAMVAANDWLAISYIDATARDGRNILEELSIVGFDNLQLASSYQLTTVPAPLSHLGQEAGRLVLQRLATKGGASRMEIVVNPSLLVRASTKSPIRMA